ncbi:NifU family protein [Amycolatopsis decaplanina]|uniref:Fe-s cluster assembly nifu-like protein n=1 Tax=Amycolatopsis decaplanina DSM 44594 TaxID=1284240 RepID=M2YU42_9PSEU|nr:NifU family protein [Amycolatopsis decaplanina]EME52243.1 fe-s cluster assembly nifu-like protein [Amycolatopsis decaplanina DSM 44594]
MSKTADIVGDRMERMLRELPEGRGKQITEELIRLVVGMYGEGLERVAVLLAEHDRDTLLRLADDDLVGSLLLLHDLHPVDVDTRIQRALDRVRPYLGSHAGGVEYLGVDGDGVARLRLEGNCQGCPSSSLTVKMAIEGAIEQAAPEITGVEVAGVPAPDPDPVTVLQVGMGPPDGWHAPEPSGGTASSGWSVLPDLGPPAGRPVSVPVEGLTVLVCSVRGTLYAYRDACAACGSSLGESTIDGEVLSCAGCGARFDVRLAGKGVDDGGLRLDPLPLLSDSEGVRVAVPKAVSS